MNKELLAKLVFQAAAQVSPLLEGKEWQQVYNEKFAELIVKECIAVHEDDYGVDIIGDVLKKHFGVEE